jgi:threonylcarbamoyladenosine tRNA methylthiotransferase MtaB
MPSFSIQNFGCRVNQAEAFAWAEAFRERGLRLEDDPGRSDLVLVNSCTLTGRADRDVRRFVERVSRRNPGAGLVITGCLAEATREELAGMPQVRLVLANREKHRLTEEVMALVGDPDAVAAAGDAAEAAAPYRSRGLLKVQDGCDHSCTFCIIPSVRGRSSSASQAEILARVKALVGRGYREVVLAGIHLSSYGQDLEPKDSLLGLLHEVEKVPGLGRLRLSSLDPRRTDRALVDHVAGNPKVCQHFHLSLQHASARVLREMGRAADGDAHEALLAVLRERSPEAAIGADIIVGFPGETEEDFARLEDFVRRSPLTYVHVFSYSPRPGTPAAARPQLPGRIKRWRAAALRRLSGGKTRRFRESFVGRELDGVAIRSRGGGERPSLMRSRVGEDGVDFHQPREEWDRRTGGSMGIPIEHTVTVLTGNAISISVPAGAAAPREMVRVRIERVLPHAVEGMVVR